MSVSDKRRLSAPVNFNQPLSSPPLPEALAIGSVAAGVGSGVAAGVATGSGSGVAAGVVTASGSGVNTGKASGVGAGIGAAVIAGGVGSSCRPWLPIPVPELLAVPVPTLLATPVSEPPVDVQPASMVPEPEALVLGGGGGSQSLFGQTFLKKFLTLASLAVPLLK